MTGSPADQRSYEPRNAQEVMDEFPGWSVSQGINQLYYARREDSALLSGEDLTDVRWAIVRWLWRHEHYAGERG